MPDSELPEELAVSRQDYVASAAKALVGSVPFTGSLLVEIASHIIPNQRLDRIARFAAELEARLTAVEQDAARAYLTDEEFTDLVEEGLRQAARSTTDDRRRQIASVIANGLSAENVSFIESKHVLRILGELNDLEVIWLCSFLHPAAGGDPEFATTHQAVLKHRVAALASPQHEVDQVTLQRSCKEHLERMGLIRPRYVIDQKSETPVYERDGRPKTQGHQLTNLGKLVLRQIGYAKPSRTSSERPPEDRPVG